MKQRILDFIVLLVFVWVSMLLGLWVIDKYIVPMEIPGIYKRSITNVIQIIIGTSMVVLWLRLWRWLAKKMFWRALHNKYTITPSDSPEFKKADRNILRYYGREIESS